MLIAEDHSEWDKVTQLPEAGGLGFDATWYAAFYHNLIGDSDMAGGRARLLKSAGFGDDRVLSDTELTAQATSHVALKLTFSVAYDSEPPAGIHTTDVALKTSLALSL